MALKEYWPYPWYGQKADGSLIVVFSPNEMYLIQNRGTNPMCEGISIDHYVTRKMVLKHKGRCADIKRDEFILKYDALFSAIKEKITAK